MCVFSTLCWNNHKKMTTFWCPHSHWGCYSQHIIFWEAASMKKNEVNMNLNKNKILQIRKWIQIKEALLNDIDIFLQRNKCLVNLLLSTWGWNLSPLIILYLESKFKKHINSNSKFKRNPNNIIYSSYVYIWSNGPIYKK